MYNKFASDTEAPTTDKYVGVVVDRESCGKHKASKGFPCWVLENSLGIFLQGVCNRRAHKAGFNNKINEKSLRLNRPARK